MRNVRHAVALTFDDNTSRAVRSVVDRLAVVYRMIPAPAFPPHVTLAVCTGLDLSGFEATLKRCVQATHALEGTLASVGIFPIPEGVVYLGVAPSPPLVALQAEIVARLSEVGAEVERYWIPGQWVPHCTLATGLPLELIPGVIERSIQDFAPVTGVLTRVNVVEVESGQVCYAHDLDIQQS